MTWGKRRALVIGFLILFLGVIVWAASKPARLPSNAVLVIDASGEIDEQREPDFFADLTGEGKPVLHDYIDAIDAAKGDSRIQGLVVRVAPLATGWAKLEEIRNHLLEFRKSGKPSICYLGYDGIGNPEYYLASACQEVWLVPQSSVTIRGMMAQALFLRGTLDKLKIVPEYYHIAEYKTATNTFTEKKFTAAHREEVEGMLQGVYGQYLTDASAARGMDRAKFEEIVTRGPLLNQRSARREDCGQARVLGPGAGLFQSACRRLESGVARALSHLFEIERRRDGRRTHRRDSRHRLDLVGPVAGVADVRIHHGRRFGGGGLAARAKRFESSRRSCCEWIRAAGRWWPAK